MSEKNGKRKAVEDLEELEMEQAKEKGFKKNRTWHCQLLQEWKIKVEGGTITLVVPYFLKEKVRDGGITEDNCKTLGEGLVVRLVDPGVRDPFAVYSSDGITIDIGNKDDRARLCDIRQKADAIAADQEHRKDNSSS